MKKLTVEAITLEEALKEAQMRGLRLASTGIGTHRSIDELLDELDGSCESPSEYTLFGEVIVRIPDAWLRDAEVFHLE